MEKSVSDRITKKIDQLSKILDELWITKKKTGIQRQTKPRRTILRYKYPKNVKTLVEKYIQQHQAQQVLTQNMYVCQICYSCKIDIILSPCGHTVCSKCFLFVVTCPFCRSKIKTRYMLNFSKLSNQCGYCCNLLKEHAILFFVDFLQKKLIVCEECVMIFENRQKVITNC